MTMAMNRIAFGAALLASSFSRANAQNASPVDRMLEGGAVEAVIWGMPAVNYDLMLQAALKVGAKENEIVFWGQTVRLAQPDAHSEPRRDLPIRLDDSALANRDRAKATSSARCCCVRSRSRITSTRFDRGMVRYC